MPNKSAFLTIAFVAAMAALLAVQQAAAATEVIVGVGFGSGYGYGDGYDDDDNGGDYQNVYYGGVSCWKGKEIVRWRGFKNVVPYDCSAPVYKYKAWKHGQPYRVSVNWKGHIVSVKPL